MKLKIKSKTVDNLLQTNLILVFNLSTHLIYKLIDVGFITTIYYNKERK